MSQISQDALAERGVLASIFEDPEVFPVVSEILEPDDFFEPQNAIIYAVMLTMYQAGDYIGVIQVQHQLTKAGTAAQAGGLPYLLELTNPEAPYAYIAALVDYIDIVRENADLRKLQSALAISEEKTRPGSNYNFDEALSYAEGALHAIAEVTVRTDIARMSDFIDTEFDAMIERGELPDGIATGVPTGFTDLDKDTTGFHPGQVIIIAARPAMGKSTLAIDFARGASIRAGKTSLVFSLEMGKQEIVQRVLAAESLVELKKIRAGKGLTNDDWRHLKRAKEELSNSNLMIDDNPSLNLVSLRTKCLRQQSSKEGLDIVIIDYLQLMDFETKGSNLSREQLVSAGSRGIKLLAKELGVPIIILCQLNRKVEERSEKVPMASDLRESGSLEQDADIILLLHRPESYDVNDRPGQADLIIAKHRNGPTGKIVLVPLLNVSKFASSTGIFPADMIDPVEEGTAPEDTEYDPYAVPDEDAPREFQAMQYQAVQEQYQLDPFADPTPPYNGAETILPKDNTSTPPATMSEPAW